MQVQLIVAGEHHNGQAIPVNIPSFTIGRAEGCNLRSRSPQVSRFHCSIAVSDNAVTIQDLGGENGTFVNGNRVSSTQTLKDGDKLVVGTHSFVVSIKAGASKVEPGGTGANQREDFFELTPSSVSQAGAEQSDPTRSAGASKTVVMKENAQKPEQENEVMFEVRLDGQRVSVTKSRLFDLARRGSLLPDDLVTVAGTKVFADSIQGIVFGNQSSAPPSPTPQPVAAPTNSAVSTSSAPAAAPVVDPFAFPDLGGTAGEPSPFDNIANEPVVRIAKRESAFRAIWNALDITFSRVYMLEGNSLAIHSLKALYYVIMVGSALVIFLMWLDVAVKCYGAHKEGGNALEMLSSHFFGLAVVTFGCVLIIVIVRILIEMLLLAWIEAARAERENDKQDDR